MFVMKILRNTVLISLLIAALLRYAITEVTQDDVVIIVCDTDDDSLVKLVVNETHTEEFRTVPAGSPTAIDYDSVEEQFYFIQLSPPSIERTDINGETVTTVFNLPDSSYSLAIDKDSRRLFYAGYINNDIVSMDLTGSNPVTILDSQTVRLPDQIIIHERQRRIIWSDGKDGAKISSSNYDGSDILKIVDTSSISFGLALDKHNELLYWTELSPSVIQSVSLDGSNRNEIYRDESNDLYNIFLLGSTLYFTGRNLRVHRISVDGGNADEISSTTVFGKPWGLYVHSKIPYEEKPKVESRLIHTDDLHSELVFFCNFIQHSEDVFYRVSWFVEGNLVLSSDPEKWSNGSVIENQVLTETHLREANITAYGIQISCSVEATFEEGNVSTPAVMSRRKFVGIQVSTTSVRVTQGASTDIKLSLTAPFGCGTLTHVDECRLRVKVNTLRNADQCDQAVMMPSECGASFVASRWNESVPITLFGKVTSTYESSSKKVNLNLTSPFNWAHQMWGDALLSQIQVQLTKDTSHIKTKSCYSNNDPHLKTFDGRRYEHQYDGNFTFYKHMDLPIEVQIQTARCSYSQNAWCNCGVVVRAGRTVFEINRCPGQSDIWFMDYTLCEDGGDVLEVKKRGSNYDIYLPTGGKVVVNAYGSFLNLHMFPSVQDIEKSAGLCGKMSENDACNDDFVLRDGSYSTDPTTTDGCNAGYKVWVNVLTNFSRSWSVENGSNLFDHSDLSSLSSWPQQKTFCSCSTERELNDPLQEVECSAGKAHETCKSLPGYSDVAPSKCIVNRRRRRSVREAQGAPFHHVHKRNANTWPGNWTEEAATEHCKKLFNESKSIQICQNITGGETNSSIDSCVLDIKLTDTTDFGKYSVDSVRSKCYHEVLVNPVLQENDTSSSGSQSVYDIVVAEVCPSDCSSNGNCSEGTCYCLPNFGGLDCSVDLSAPPFLSSVHDSHCDTSSLSCDFISVYGETFTEESTCLVKAFKVRGSGPELEWSRVSNASVQSISHVKCNISVSKELGDTDYVRALWISVSNDGTLYSNNVSVLVYDGSCVTGNIDGTDISWTKQNSFCFYGEICYMNGETRIDDNCKVCVVNGSSASWEDSRASNCTDSQYPITTDSTTEAKTEPLAKTTTGATTQSRTESTTQSTTETTTRATTQTTTKTTRATTQSTIESKTQQTDATSQPTTKTTKPITEAPTQPTREATTQSKSQPTKGETTQPKTQPTTQPRTVATARDTTKPTTEATTQPISESTSHSTTKAKTHPTTEPTTGETNQPKPQSTTLPTTEAKAGDPTQPTTKATTQPTTEATAGDPTQPTTESTTQPTSKATTRHTTEPTTEETTHPKTPTTQPTTEATAGNTTIPTAKATTQPTTESTTKPISKATTYPTTGETTHPKPQPTTEATVRDITQPTTKATTQPATESTTQPTTKVNTRPTTEATAGDTTQTTSEVKTQPPTGETTQQTTRATAQPTTETATQPTTKSSSKAAIELPIDGTTILTTELPTEATTEVLSTWTAEDDTMTTKLPVSDRSKMDFNTVTALSVAGGIGAFVVIVVVISFITIKVWKPNNQMQESRLEKAVNAHQNHSFRQEESWNPDHFSRLDDTKMPRRWSLGHKFISTTYIKRPDFGHI